MVYISVDSFRLHRISLHRETGEISDLIGAGTAGHFSSAEAYIENFAMHCTVSSVSYLWDRGRAGM